MVVVYIQFVCKFKNLVLIYMEISRSFL